MVRTIPTPAYKVASTLHNSSIYQEEYVSTTVLSVLSETTTLGYVNLLAPILHMPTQLHNTAWLIALPITLMTQPIAASAHALVLTSEIQPPSNACSYAHPIPDNISKYLMRAIDDAI